MRKLLTTFALASALLALSPGSASAGGSWIELDGPAIVGTTVSPTGLFGDGQQAPVSAGPWVATLRPEAPGVERIALGPVQIVESNSWGWRATVTFVVPDVPTGEYWVDVRNEAGEGVGDLIGGFFVIAHTPLEGALWTRASTAEEQALIRLREVNHLRGVKDKLELALRDVEVTLYDRQATIERQTDRLTASGARIAELASELEDGSPTGTWTYVLAALAALLLAAGAFGLGRRSYATRTLVTGASRSWTENQEPPASADPNTSPLVAPK